MSGTRRGAAALPGTGHGRRPGLPLLGGGIALRTRCHPHPQSRRALRRPSGTLRNPTETDIGRARRAAFVKGVLSSLHTNAALGGLHDIQPGVAV